MWFIKIIRFLNIKVVYYRNGFITYRKSVRDNEIRVFFKMIYPVSIGQSIISNDNYTLTEKVTLKALIAGYRNVIDELNTISKK